MEPLLFADLIQEFDQFFGQIGHRFVESGGDFLNIIMRYFTYLGNSGLGFIVAALILLLFKKTRKLGVMAAIAIALGALITNITLKNLIARDRPFWDPNSIYYSWWVAAGSLAQDGFSFPSGHATVAMAFGFPMFLSFNKKTSWLWLLMAVAMAFSRVYFSVHYASDVLVGSLVGMTTGTIAYFSFNPLMKIGFVKKIYEFPSITALFMRPKKIKAQE